MILLPPSPVPSTVVPQVPPIHTPYMRLAVLGDYQPPGTGIFRDRSQTASSTQDSKRNEKRQFCGFRHEGGECKPLVCPEVRVMETKRK